jgi:2-polyprenyl-6-hydroxyphenyl methylase/3-demethylubiquinone-9 3-methyltransferase
VVDDEADCASHGRDGVIKAASDYYDDYWSDADHAEPDPDTPARWDAVDRFLHVTVGTRVLDVGCGAGFLAARLLARGASAAGMDISSRAIEAAAGRYPGVDFHTASADGAPWPFDDSSFDAVVALEVVEHLFAPAFFFSEARRLLKPGGQLVVSTPYHGRMKNLVLAFRGFDRHFDVNGAHIRFFTPGALSRAYSTAGFSRPRMIYYGRVRLLAHGMVASGNMRATSE